MATANITIAGRKTISGRTSKGTTKTISGLWHLLGTGAYGGLKAGGSVKLERTSENNKNVNVSGNCTSKLDYYSGSGWQYDYPLKLAIIVGGTLNTSNNSSDNSNVYISGNYKVVHLFDYEIKSGGGYKQLGNNYSHTFPNGTSIEWTGTENVTSPNKLYICFYCGQGVGQGWDGCSVGYDKNGGRGHSSYVVIGEIDIKSLPYVPYKKPTVTVSSSPTGTYSIYNQNRKITVGKNTSGDSTSTTVKVTVKNKEYSTNFGNNSGELTFKPSDAGVSDAEEYTVKATRTHSKYKVDGSYSSATASIKLRTYTLPRIKNLSVTNKMFGGRKNNPISWQTNGKYWTEEKNFITYYQLGSKKWMDIKVNNPTSVKNKINYETQNANITQSMIESLFTANERSVNHIDTTLQLKRVNPSSGEEAFTDKINITIQYAPTMPVKNLIYTNADTGQIIPPRYNDIYRRSSKCKSTMVL